MKGDFSRAVSTCRRTKDVLGFVENARLIRLSLKWAFERVNQSNLERAVFRG